MTSAQVGIDALAFFATLALAWIFRWSTTDLVWSFWLMSWTTGIAGVALSRAGSVLAPDLPGAGRVALAIGGLVAVLGHGLHMSLFHVAYAHIVSGALPLVEDPTRVYLGNLTWTIGKGFTVHETLAEAIRRYWPFILISVLRDAPAMLRQDLDGSVWAAYKRMFRMHALVMLSIVLFLMGAESFYGLAFVFLILFSPPSLWRALWQRQRPAGT